MIDQIQEGSLEGETLSQGAWRTVIGDCQNKLWVKKSVTDLEVRNEKGKASVGRAQRPIEHCSKPHLICRVMF